MDGWVSGWTNGEWIDVDEWMNGGLAGLIVRGWTKWMDGWVVKWLNGWFDERWKDIHVHVHVCIDG